MLLLCYQYDPARGKYGLLIQNVIRFAGVATVLLMAGGIGLMIIRDRRKRHTAPPASSIPQGDS
jgi:hypothetical protein